MTASPPGGRLLRRGCCHRGTPPAARPGGPRPAGRRAYPPTASSASRDGSCRCTCAPGLGWRNARAGAGRVGGSGTPQANQARSCCTRSLALRLTHRGCWRRDHRNCFLQPGRAADPRTPGGRRDLGGQPGQNGRSVARRAPATPRQGPQVHRACPPPAQQRPPRVHLRHHPGGGGDGGGRPGPGPPAGQRGTRRVPPGCPGGGRCPGDGGGGLAGHRARRPAGRAARGPGRR